MNLSFTDWMGAAADLTERGKPFVCLTVVNSRGSTPQEPGAKALITSSGIVLGTVGGGKVEAKAIEHAKMLLAEHHNTPDLKIWNLRKDVGMTCGGEMTILFEPYATKHWDIVVFGAGHVSQCLIRLLLTLDCRIQCVDSREEWLEKLPNHSKLSKHLLSEPKDYVKNMPANAFAVLMTQGHGTDVPILHQILNICDLPYVGVIGSKSKRAVMEKELTELGIAEGTRSMFHCPIGLDIGRDEPEEIAVSIVAQLLAERSV